MKQSIKNILYFVLPVFICFTSVDANSSGVNRPSYKIRKIMIDPGFGGEESGPRSSCPDSKDSKDINLSISFELAKTIRERLAIDVALTRDADRTVSLAECKRLNSVEYQKDLCEGIVQGLEKYIDNLNFKGVDITQPQH